MIYFMYMSAKELAIKLRHEGYFYSYIAAQTGLSKSTLSYHLATIPFTPNKKALKSATLAQVRSAQTKHKQKQLRMDEARSQAVKEFERLSKRDIFIAGIALYAGEGSKTQNLIRLVNSDFRVVCFFINWLETLGVTKDHIVLRVHGYPDTDREVAEAYWIQTTKIPKVNIQPMCIDYRVNKDRKRSGVHPYGTAHVSVRANGKIEFGTALARKIAVYMELLLG